MQNKPQTVSPNECLSLRQKTLQQRDKLSSQEIQTKSSALQDSLWQLEAVQKATTIFTYVHFRSEVSTDGFIKKCLQHKINICVPLTITKPPHLVAYELTNPYQQLRVGYCGIPEPDPAKTNMVNPQIIDIIILPGSVFDHNGGRMGYGGGYYDRFLENDAPNAIRIGLAFDLQVKDNIPLMAHDQRINYLITENRILHF